MIVLKAALSAVVATALIAAPVSAETAAAQTRSSAPVRGDPLFGFGWGWFVLLLIAGGAIYLLTKNDTPASP